MESNHLAIKGKRDAESERKQVTCHLKLHLCFNGFHFSAFLKEEVSVG